MPNNALPSPVLRYAARKRGGKMIKEHRLVANTPAGMAVHHINHDRSDNRPENLVVVSVKENNRLNAVLWKVIREKVGDGFLQDITHMAIKEMRNE